MLYRLLLTKFEWPSQPRRSALIRLTLLRNLNRFEDAESRAEAVRRALRLYSHARAIISDCTEPLAVEWKLSEPQIGKVLQAFESVVGGDWRTRLSRRLPSLGLHLGQRRIPSRRASTFSSQPSRKV